MAPPSLTLAAVKTHTYQRDLQKRPINTERDVYPSDVDSGNSIHAIPSSSLTQVLQLYPTSSCPRRPTHQLSLYSNFSIPHSVDSIFDFFRLTLSKKSIWTQTLKNHDFLHSGRMAKFLPGQSELQVGSSCVSYE